MPAEGSPYDDGMPSDRRARNALLVDGALAVFVLILGLTSRNELDGIAFGYTREPDALNSLIIVLQTLPLALRRRYPRTVLAVIMGTWAVDRVLDYPSTLASAGLILAIHAIGSEMPARNALRIGVPLSLGVAVFTFIGSLVYESVDLVAVVVTFVSIAGPLALGMEVHQRRLHTQKLEERAARAEREREESAQQAVADERARIARELHDVVAHQMAVMTVQAEGARRLARGADPRIGEALDVIRAAGHEALTEMRRMVGLLRAAGPDDGGRPAPQPSLDQIEALARQITEAGLPVDLRIEGDRRPLAPGLDMSAYRIVQESLTNALKHAGAGAMAQVCLTYGPDELMIEVTDDGHGAAARLVGGDGGHGLVGLRERAAVVNGRFEAGPRPGGGFVVRAKLPVHA